MSGEMAALGAAVAWAVGNLTLKPLADRYHFLTLNAVRTVAANVAVWSALLALGKVGLLAEFPAASTIGLIASATLGLMVGDSLYYVGVARMQISSAYTISQASYPLFAAAIAIIFLGERLGVLEGIGAAAVVAGLLLVSWPARAEAPRAGGRADRVAVALVLASAIVWAVAVTWTRSALGDGDAVAALAVRNAAVGLLLVAVIRAREGRGFLRRWPRGLSALNAWGGGALNALGAILFFYSMQKTGVAKASIISGLSPLFLILMAAALMRERLTALFLVGAAVCSAGVLLLA